MSEKWVSRKRKIRQGHYLIKSHAVRQALKEGFERTHMVEAILEGTIIEEYPNDQPVLICGKTTLAKTTDITSSTVWRTSRAEGVASDHLCIPGRRD